MSLIELNEYDILLASQSPRRKLLLSFLKLKFDTLSPDIEEYIKKNEPPLKYAMRVAKEKAQKISNEVQNKIIIAADTIVLLDSIILGKPQSEIEAVRMLSFLSGKTHIVITGVCIINQNTTKILTDYEKTKVTFRKISKKEINEYVESGSPMDKAGGYGIQEDFGAVFVKKIDGCYYNVVGLPLSKTYNMLMKIIK